MWGGDGGGSKKRVFLGCKKHAFSVSEEKPIKSPTDHKKTFFFEGWSEEEPKKPPAHPKEEIWGEDGGRLQKRVFLGCKKHAFSGSEEEPKEPPADLKRRFF